MSFALSNLQLILCDNKAFLSSQLGWMSYSNCNDTNPWNIPAGKSFILLPYSTLKSREKKMSDIKNEMWYTYKDVRALRP